MNDYMSLKRRVERLERAINEANGMYGNYAGASLAYLIWRWLLDSPDARPMDIKRAMKDLYDAPEDHTSMRISEMGRKGAIIKNGRTYTANPDYKWRPSSMGRYAEIQ